MNKEQKIMDAKIMQAKGERQKEIAKVLGVTERTVRICARAMSCAETTEEGLGIFFFSLLMHDMN
ncbi:MAG TPA: hypothetical protein PLH80_11090 [Spirochaetota bacterium]|nr:hypothetical protein [Spirochaetota bacterium]